MSLAKAAATWTPRADLPKDRQPVDHRLTKSKPSPEPLPSMLWWEQGSLPFGPDISWLPPQGTEPSLHSVYGISETPQVLLEPQNHRLFTRLLVGVLRETEPTAGAEPTAISRRGLRI